MAHFRLRALFIICLIKIIFSVLFICIKYLIDAKNELKINWQLKYTDKKIARDQIKAVIFQQSFKIFI